MTLTVFPTPGFGKGLNTRDKPDVVDPSEAIDLLNVTFSERGAVSQRFGYDELTSSALTNRVASMEPYYTTGGTTQLIAGCGTRLEALSTAGAVVASDTGNNAGVWDFERHGTPGSEYMYAGNSANNLHRWNGSAWSDLGAGSPEAGALGSTSWDNRLVATKFTSATGGPAGATANPSYVWFSDEGAPETWTATSFVQLRPGDGETVQAVIGWRELLFVFKESSFFVFTGTSTDAAGAPIFEFYPVDTGHGLVSPRAVCADETGVYFLDRNGVYRTTGREPEPVSDVITPIFEGGSSDFFLGGELLHSQITNAAMWTHDQRIYLSYTITGTANTRTLVYDPRYDWWSLWDIAAACGASFRVSSQPELVFGLASGNNDIMRMNSTETNDAGTAITSRWRGGWFDFGEQAEKRLRWTILWGTGTPFHGISTDFEQGTGTLGAIDLVDDTSTQWGSSTWGGGTWASPASLIEGLHNYSAQGVVFSHYLFNNTLDQSWSVHRLESHVAGIRTPAAVSVP